MLPADGSSAKTDAKPRVASLTKYIPFDSVAHAGGQYVGAHYRALAPFADVRVIAPNTPINRDAVQRPGAPQETLLLRGVGPGGKGGFKLLGDLESAWAGSAISWPYRRLFQTGAAPWGVLADARIVELQWSEMIALAPAIRARQPRSILVGVAHDVITQRWERAAEAAQGATAAGYRLAAGRSRAQETRSFAALDLLIVFSEKDALLARAVSPRTRVEVVHPGLGPDEPMERKASADEPIVLFTGALGRLDNSRGIAWFIENAWAEVLRAVPRARLVVAGAHPPAALESLIARTPRAELTGFVESLEPYYAAASVFIAPVLTGAGVKFKTIDAMLRNIPVIATSVGAEGIDAQELLACVADDADAFSAAVISELREPDLGRAQRAAAWAQQVYGVEAFQQRVRDLYLSLIFHPDGVN